jgi:hypothetical protein
LAVLVSVVGVEKLTKTLDTNATEDTEDITLVFVKL